MSERAESNRRQLHRIVSDRPFKPFWIRLESGDRIDVKHPETIGFDPEEGGNIRLYVVARGNDVWTSLDAVTGLSVPITEEETAA